MKLPDTGRKKALIVVDVQPAFLKPHNRHIVKNICSIIDQVHYDAYVQAVFSSEKGSLWDTQQGCICPRGDDTHTHPQIEKGLGGKKALKVHKHTRSVFRGNQDVTKYLREHDVEEVHLVGTETNDCVLATALDAFDSGFSVYVIEECCESATSGRHQMGVDILRLQKITNNSCLADTIKLNI